MYLVFCDALTYGDVRTLHVKIHGMGLVDQKGKTPTLNNEPSPASGQDNNMVQ